MRETLENSDGWEVITSKKLRDRHEDYIQIYRKRRHGGGWLLSDGGDTMMDVACSGVDMEKPSFKARIDENLGLLDVDMELDNTLTLEADDDNLTERVGRLIWAVHTINALVEQELSLS